jgi:hypothetical protein
VVEVGEAMKTTSYALLFIAMDVIPSTVLWLLSPTDSVRVWYPTIAAYTGEHLTGALVIILAGWIVASRIGVAHLPFLRLNSAISKLLGFVFLCVVVDLAATLMLAFLQSRDFGVVHLWHTQTLSGYLLTREPLYFGFAAVVAISAGLRMRRERTTATVTRPAR